MHGIIYHFNLKSLLEVEFYSGKKYMVHNNLNLSSVIKIMKGMWPDMSQQEYMFCVLTTYTLL